MKEKWFMAGISALSFNAKVPKTNNSYRFFRGRPLLIKNDEDIKYFESHPETFTECGGFVKTNDEDNFPTTNVGEISEQKEEPSKKKKKAKK